MTRSFRLTDLVLVLGAIALGAILVGQGAESRAAAGAPGPFTVGEAVSFYSDAPMVVRGWLVTRRGRTLLCERRACAGAALVVRGRVAPRAADGPVLALGTVTGRRLVLHRLPPRGRAEPL